MNDDVREIVARVGFATWAGRDSRWGEAEWIDEMRKALAATDAILSALEDAGKVIHGTCGSCCYYSRLNDSETGKPFAICDTNQSPVWMRQIPETYGCVHWRPEQMRSDK